MYRDDEILGFETDTVWGMGAHPKNKNSIEKIYEFKGRDRKKPLILMSSKIEYLFPYIKNVPDYSKKLMEKFFPGAITLIFEKTALCPDYITSNMNTVGIRIPNHKGFYNIAENFEGRVLATTSLNFSDEPPVKNYDEAVFYFADKIKIIKPDMEADILGRASTIVLCTENKPKVLRQGDIFI